MAKKTQGGSVKAIIPSPFRSEAVMRILKQEMEKYVPFLLKDFQNTIRHWKGEKPRFVKALIVKPDSISIQIRVTGSEKGKNKWHWLNEGTRPHKIRAKNAKVLRFRGGYKAGSKPNSRFTVGATAAKGDWASKQEVNHPGFPARNWSTIIMADNQRPFAAWMQGAMSRAAAASGHAVKK